MDIESTDEIEIIYISSSGQRARVFLNDAASEAMKLTQVVEEIPTCCTDNQVFLQNQNGGRPKIQRHSKPVWKSEWIFALANQFVSDSEIHRATQGTHSCYLSVNGELHFSAEDIGRHNAIDKAIGYAVMRGFKREDCILYTTGRVATDMVRKVIMSGFPILVSKSVPTNAAVKMACANNLVLICKAWPDQFEVFNDVEQ